MATKQTFTRFNVISVLFASFGSLYCGYTLAVIISTLGQPTFYSSLGLVTDPTDPGYGFTNAVISTANGIFFAGAFSGALVAGALSSKLGRIRIFQMSSIVGIIGGAIQTGAISAAMYLVARFITGLGMGLSFAVVPVWVSEVSPPQFRGLMAGMHGCFINVGYFSANWIGFACFWASTDTSFGWRFPNAVIIIWAVLLLAGTFIIPESPRWLVTKERDDEALEILCRLHHDPSDPQDTFAHQELLLIRNQIADDNKQQKTGGRWQIVTEKTYRKRLIVALMTTVGSQNTGILVINNFNALLYASLGLNNWQALLLSAGYNTWAMIANFFGATISDRFGRRRLLLIGFISNVACFVVATGLVAQYSESPTSKWAALSVTFLFLYVTCHGIFIDPNCWVVAAEIFPSHLRSQGNAIAVAGVTLADLLWLQLAPTAQMKIGWKYYLVFICLGIVHIIYFYFRLPETTGLALEEIDVLFGKEPVNRLQDTVGQFQEKQIEAQTVELTS